MYFHLWTCSSPKNESFVFLCGSNFPNWIRFPRLCKFFFHEVPASFTSKWKMEKLWGDRKRQQKGDNYQVNNSSTLTTFRLFSNFNQLCYLLSKTFSKKKCIVLSFWKLTFLLGNDPLHVLLEDVETIIGGGMDVGGGGNAILAANKAKLLWSIGEQS